MIILRDQRQNLADMRMAFKICQGLRKLTGLPRSELYCEQLCVISSIFCGMGEGFIRELGFQLELRGLRDAEVLLLNRMQRDSSMGDASTLKASLEQAKAYQIAIYSEGESKVLTFRETHFYESYSPWSWDYIEAVIVRRSELKGVRV